jgi:hypothetical protein
LPEAPGRQQRFSRTKEDDNTGPNLAKTITPEIDAYSTTGKDVDKDVDDIRQDIELRDVYFS